MKKKKPSLRTSICFFLSFAVTAATTRLVAGFSPNYLNSLNNNMPEKPNGASFGASFRPPPFSQQQQKQQQQPPAPNPVSPRSGEPLETYGRPYMPPKTGSPSSSSSSANSPFTVNNNNNQRTAAAAGLYHASLDEFHVDRLQDLGPRAQADVGNPREACRDWVTLGNGNDQGMSVGSWYCGDAGGWMSPKQRTSTEVFFVLQGRGCVTDADGVPHEFGPGDTVTLPKGWSGRWDVLEPVHKVRQ